MQIRPILATGIAIGIVAGCTPGEPEDAAVGAAEMEPAAMAVAPFPVPELSPEPVAEPMPSPSANPSQIPERVAQILPENALETVRGQATFYADRFEGRRTASGIPFRQNQMVAAHRAYPFGTVLRVTNISNKRSVNVRVVDRGPFGSSRVAQRTVIDLSSRAAQQLGFIDEGRTEVRVEVLEWGRGMS